MTPDQPTAPEAVFFSLTLECPMRCKVCSMWQLKDPDGALTLNQRLEVIDQLLGFGSKVHVVVTGGEPFRKFGELLAMGRRLRAQGNTMGVVTSGFFLTPGVVERIAGSGITHIAVSIDFPTEAQHDAQRGRPGTFSRAVSAVHRLVKMRRDGEEVPSVGINSIIMAQNVNYLEDLALLAADLGVEEILFQPIQPDFGADDSVALGAFRYWLPMDPRRVDDALARLDGLRPEVPLGRSPEEFQSLREYFRNPFRLRAGTCQSPKRNLMVDVLRYRSHGLTREKVCFVSQDENGDLARHLLHGLRPLHYPARAAGRVMSQTAKMPPIRGPSSRTLAANQAKLLQVPVHSLPGRGVRDTGRDLVTVLRGDDHPHPFADLQEPGELLVYLPFRPSPGAHQVLERLNEALRLLVVVVLVLHLHHPEKARPTRPRSVAHRATSPWSSVRSSRCGWGSRSPGRSSAGSPSWSS